MADSVATELCSQCNEPVVRFCRCIISERCCKNHHSWYYDSKGNRVEGSSHNVQENVQENVYSEKVELCSKCGEAPVAYCKCEIGERICKKGHHWYFDENGYRCEGTSHN